MRRASLFLVLITVAVLTAGPVASTTAKRSCGAITKTYSHGSYRFSIRVEHGKVSCKTARAVMRKALVRNARVEGWHCFTPPASAKVDKLCGQPKSARENFRRSVSARLLH